MSTPTILSKVTSQDGTLWEVSGSNGAVHIVAHDWDGWMCTCPDHYYRKSFCKHMKVCANSEGIGDKTLGWLFMAIKNMVGHIGGGH